MRRRPPSLRRESFPYEQQFNILMRFIVDQTQTPNLKVKVAILRYIEALARQMDPADFVNSSETRLAVSRIITWTTEPKSSDVRKVGGWGSRGCRGPTSPPSHFSLPAFFTLDLIFHFCPVISTSVSGHHHTLRLFITGQGRSVQAEPAPWPPCLERATWRRGASR